MSHLGEKRIYYIDSDLKESGSHSDFTYNLTIPNHCDSVSVMQITIPKSYYLVQANQSFTLTENNVDVNIPIPEGNYSQRSFRTVLATQLNLFGSYTYTISYPATTEADTGKYTYTTSNNNDQPSFTFPSSSTLYRQMGFDPSSTNTFTSETLESSNVLDFQKSSALYLLSDLSFNNANAKQSDNVLQEIFVSNDLDYSRVSFVNQNIELTAKRLDANKQTYTFKLIDNDGNTLDLNGHQINLSIVCFRRSDNHELQRQMSLISLAT